MMTRRTQDILSKLLINKRHLHKTAVINVEHENPLWRTFRILRDDLKVGKRLLLNENPAELLANRLFPQFVDVLIIGGGAIGSSIAYWLKERTIKDGLNVTVVEKDPLVSTCIVFLES